MSTLTLFSFHGASFYHMLKNWLRTQIGIYGLFYFADPVLKGFVYFIYRHWYFRQFFMFSGHCINNIQVQANRTFHENALLTLFWMCKLSFFLQIAEQFTYCVFIKMLRTELCIINNYIFHKTTRVLFDKIQFHK